MCKSSKNEPFVSVLTPVYNGGEYLEECIQSVLNQNYSNWEYVIVNNQSTDNSLEIIEKYARMDDRIRVHNNDEFLPQMQNLNHAFRQISSESKYCKVVHTDDWLFPECITQMVELNEKYPSVGIVSSYRIDDRMVGLDGLAYPSHFNSGKEIARKHLMHGTSYFGSPSSILIRSDLIRKREKVYAESHLASDTGACVDFLQDSDFGFVHQVLTYTRRHDMSMTNTAAKQSYAFLHARFHTLLNFGPVFLNETEYQKSIAQHINKYYILLARNLVESKSLKDFNRQLEVLKQLKLKFESRKFARNLLREMGLQFFKAFGVQLNKAA